MGGRLGGSGGHRPTGAEVAATRPYPAAMGPISRLREHLVLGAVRRQLENGEQVLAWSHAQVPETRAPGLFVVTDRRCLLHVTNPSVEDVDTPLERFRLFDLDRRNASTARVRLRGEHAEVVAEFSLTSRARSRAMGRVLTELQRADIHAPDTFDPTATSPLQPIERGVRDHARRIWVTVAGLFVLLLSLLFASPFVPGPGALTAVAGLAILAREYEWARDVHLWAARKAELFVSWMRERARRRGRRRSSPQPIASEPATPVVDRTASPPRPAEDVA